MLQDFNKKVIAFADEYGDVDLETDKTGTSVLYVPVAVLVHEEAREEGGEEADRNTKSPFLGKSYKIQKCGRKTRQADAHSKGLG